MDGRLSNSVTYYLRKRETHIMDCNSCQLKMQHLIIRKQKDWNNCNMLINNFTRQLA